MGMDVWVGGGGGGQESGKDIQVHGRYFCRKVGGGAVEIKSQ